MSCAFESLKIYSSVYLLAEIVKAKVEIFMIMTVVPKLSFFGDIHHIIAKGPRPRESGRVGVGNPPVDGLPLVQRFRLRLGTLLCPRTSHVQQLLDCCAFAWLDCKLSQVLFWSTDIP